VNRRRGLLVASSLYEDPMIARLRAPAHDVAGVGAVLGDPAIGDFDLRVLQDRPEATVRRAVGEFLGDATRSDLLLLYFACHGFKATDGQLYLGTTDTRLSNVMATTLPAELLRRLIDQSPSKRVILVLDCCFSGAINRSVSARDLDVLPVGDIFAGRDQGQGRVILTACTATEYAYEPAAAPFALRSDIGYSVFADAFVEGLRTGAADADGDGAVSVTELYEFIHQRIVTSESTQTPGMWNQITGKLFIAHRATAAPAPPVKLTNQTRRSPYDAELLDWRFGVTAGLQNAFAPTGAGVLRALRTAAGGDWATARTFFDQQPGTDDLVNTVTWWGQALCAALRRNWRQAGTSFGRAATIARDKHPDLFAGAALLSAVTLRASNSPRWHEPLDDVLERVPTCPQALAYRGIQQEDPEALGLAVQLVPEIVEDFAAVGVRIDAAASAALTEAERRASLLLRARSAVNAVLAGPVGTEVTAIGFRARLDALNRLIADERVALAKEVPALHSAAQRLLDARPSAAGLAAVSEIRQTGITLLEALRETDRPAPVWAVGVPPRRQR
jgi:hypothetical protein